MVKAKEYRSHDSSHFSTHVSIAASSPLSPSINGEFSPSPYDRSLLPLVTIAALFSPKRIHGNLLQQPRLPRCLEFPNPQLQMPTSSGSLSTLEQKCGLIWCNICSAYYNWISYSSPYFYTQRSTCTCSSTSISESTRAPVSTTPISARTTDVPTDAYGQAASNLVAGDNMDQIAQQLMDMGGGSWDKDTVTRALHAAYNNPERAVDYLYSGIPEVTKIAVPVPNFQSNLESGGTEPTALARDAPLSGVPNSSPLNLFPQEALNAGAGVGDGSLDFLRNNQQDYLRLKKPSSREKSPIAAPMVLQPLVHCELANLVVTFHFPKKTES